VSQAPEAETPKTAGEPSAADARREEVVRHAARLFDSQGYRATSMQDIADAVGLRKPSLYHYFSSKDEILHRIHDEFIELLIGRHEQRVQLGMSSKALLLEAMGDIIELMETHPGYVRVFFEAHRELPPDQMLEIVEKRTRYQELITEVFASGTREGVLRTTSPALAAQGLFGMCTWAYQWYNPAGPLLPRDIAYFFWDVLINGLSGDGPEGDRGISRPA
jgi:AcrR family transcriptional regulator